MSDELENMSDDEFEETQMVLDEQVENAPELEDKTEAPEEVVEEVEEVVEESSEETEEPVEPEEVIEPETDEVQEEEPEEEVVEEESLETDTDTTEFDYKASYETVMKPIKVSGKDIEIKSMDDLRNLASMGIDYSRKMRDVKPLRAIGETLAAAGLIKDGQVDEQALTRLLDISNGNKDAIASLLKEQNIDPLDMETDTEYTPEASMVSQEAIALQDVEAELVERGSVNSVITALDKLDTRSKQFFNESPSNLLKLEEDISSGAYEEIMGSVEYEKSLGRLGGLSDMEAYVQMAVARQPKTVEQAAPEVQAPVTPKPSSAKRKAAGISKRQPYKQKTQTYDYIGMSDDEFEKLTPDTGMY